MQYILLLLPGDCKTRDLCDGIIVAVAVACDGSKWRWSMWAARRWDYLAAWKNVQPTGGEDFPCLMTLDKNDTLHLFMSVRPFTARNK